jgi:hypothetical protein
VILGSGGDGPWEDRTADILDRHPNPFAVAGHLNAEHSVQRFQYPDYEGFDLLTVRRHDGEPRHPGWKALQAIKNRLAPDGTERFGYEFFPPQALVVDNYNLWHVWVFPIDHSPPIGLHPPHRVRV